MTDLVVKSMIGSVAVKSASSAACTGRIRCWFRIVTPPDYHISYKLLPCTIPKDIFMIELMTIKYMRIIPDKKNGCKKRTTNHPWTHTVPHQLWYLISSRSFHRSLIDIGPLRSINPNFRVFPRNMCDECSNKYWFHQMRKRLRHFDGDEEVLWSIVEARNGNPWRLIRREITQSIDHCFNEDDDVPHLGRHHNRRNAEMHPHNFEGLVDKEHVLPLPNNTLYKAKEDTVICKEYIHEDENGSCNELSEHGDHLRAF